MKKILTAGTAVILSVITSAAAFAASIPDHRGTSLDNFSIGTSKVSAKVSQYNDIFKQAGDQFGIDPNILAAVCMQESGGVNYQYRSDGSSYPAWGIMQIEYTNNGSFAKFGEDQTGCAWTSEDRLDPSKAVPYAAYLLSEALYKYDCDYAKMLQSYNFGSTVLDRIIAAAGDNWLNERANAVSYVSNWSYSTYGDKEYVEHVLRYYCNNIDYIGSKVRLNGSLVRFDNQYPIIDGGTTMIPVRAISEI
ncbi:MAG: transglycosylase SLT domain-containing protein, partial [Candidatus Ornithomonoglobus sp.]